MRRDTAALAALVVVVCVGCSFKVAATGDGGPGDGIDASALPAVSFVVASSTQDEGSGSITIALQLSKPAGGGVTVRYRFSGTATIGSDYTSSSNMVTFNANETAAVIPVTIVADSTAEPEETLIIELVDATGAELGTPAIHTIMLSDRLPRANLAAATSSASENAAAGITINLDQASLNTVMVSYSVMAGTATAMGTFADYTLASGVATFAPGVVSVPVSLGVIDDTRNELDETLTVALTTSTGAVLGTTVQQVHTITNDDPVPTVSFTQASSSVLEGDSGTTTVTMDVSLSAASGRTVVVPFTVTGTATSPSDYTISATPLTFVEGTNTQAITVTVVGDTVSEPNESVIVTIQAGINGTATLGSQPTRTLTITNDDNWCHGAGAYQVCYPTQPTSAVVLPATINTGSSALCESQQPVSGWTGQASACFIRGTSITMNQNTVVTGSRALVLVADTDITISSTLDVASHLLTSGTAPGAPAAACKVFPQAPLNSDLNGGGGGAGASFMTKAGDGGTGNGTGNNVQGLAASADGVPTILRAGCDGQRGGNSGNTSGAVGRGGGAVYLLAEGTIRISGAINASGSAGSGGGNFTGGSGAGSGGMIVLAAATVNATGGVIMANGGGGSSGGDNNGTGSDGSDPVVSAPTAPAPGGPSGNAGAAGGNGFPAVVPAITGVNGASMKGGGGGGGAGGYLKANVAITGGSISAGLVQAP